MTHHCKTHNAHVSEEHYPRGCPMCVHPEDAVTAAKAALDELYSEPYWSEATENPQHADQFAGIMAKLKAATADIEGLTAGIREEANERARAA